MVWKRNLFYIVLGLRCSVRFFFVPRDAHIFSYFSRKRDPAIIISYVISGHAFPVTENPHASKSLVGYYMHCCSMTHLIALQPSPASTATT